MMKLKPKPLALAVFFAAGTAIFCVTHFWTDLSEKEPERALDVLSQKRQEKLSAATSEQQIPSNPVDAWQARDEYVMGIIDDKTMSNEKKFAILWDGYQKNKASPMMATYYIDCLAALSPLPHLDRLLAELDDASISAEVTNHLLQLLSSAYVRNKGLDENSQRRVLEVIKANIQNADPMIAGEAVLLYARMGADDNLVKILGDSLHRQIISPLDYIHEGVFQCPNITDAKEQNSFLITLLSTEKKLESEEADHMLSGAMNLIVQSPEVLKRIDTSNRKLITEYLGSHEPTVQLAGIGYDLGKAIDYTNWLQSYATLKTKSETQVPGWISHHLVDSTGDTQKIVAVMTSQMAPEVVWIMRQTGKVDTIKNKVERDMAGLRPGTVEYSAFEAALDILK